MSSEAVSVQATLGSMARDREATVEERRRQIGTDSLPARAGVRDEREYIREGRGAHRGIEWTHTEGDR